MITHRASHLPALKLWLMLLCTFWVTAAPALAQQEGDFSYTTFGASIEILGYTGPGGIVVVPSQITGLPVRNIRNSVFANKASITGVVVPDSVTSIGNGAFEGCTGLVEVDLGNGLTTMGNDVFRGCTSLVNVNIPTSVTTVGQGVFWNCTNLNSVSVPNAAVVELHMFRSCTSLNNVQFGNGVRTIRNWAFQDCQGLTHMTIPDGVTSIRDEAFLDCTNLSSVAIGGDVSSIEHYAFSHCPALINIAVAESNSSYSDVDGVLFTHSQNTLVRYPQGRSGSYPVPNGVTSITNAAFHGCSFLTGVTIPASVTSIKTSAFFDCTALTSIIIPPNVASLANYTFSGCTVLTAVVIGEGVTDIGYRAFYGCTSLSGVSIPAGVTTIGDSAFSNSTGLVGATFRGNAPLSFGSDVFNGCAPGFTVYFYNGNTGFTSPTWKGYPAVNLGDIPFPVITTQQPTSQTVVSGTAATLSVAASGNPTPGFQWYLGASGDTTQPIPGATSSSFTTPLLFATTSYWVRATNSEGTADSNTAVITVTPAGDGLLWTSDGFQITITGYTGSGGNVVIPAQIAGLPVRIIGSTAFTGNTAVAGVTIPASVGSIDYRAFSGCTGLAEITVIEGNQAYSSVDGVLFTNNLTRLVRYPCGKAGMYSIPSSVVSVSYQAFFGCVGLTGVSLPANISSIENETFSGCTGLIGVSLPASVTNIGIGAFKGCVSLTAVTIPHGVITIGGAAFQGCVSLTAVTIPPGVITIGGSAFNGCTSLTGVTIPGSATSTGDFAFFGCTDLTTVAIEEGVVSIGTASFQECINLASVIIPGSVTEIRDQAFFECRGLTSATILGSVNSIGRSAFWGCRGLASITIPASVTSIGDRAFENCFGLTSVTIPASITSMGAGVFEYCSGLTSITLEEGLAVIGHSMFINCRSLVSVTIPGSVTSIGDYAFSSCFNMTSLTIEDGVTSIGRRAFDDCRELISVAIPASVTNIGIDAFRSCGSLVNVTLPPGVTSIGDGAFAFCRELASVVIPASVTHIGIDAFLGCDALITVTIPAGVTSIGNGAFSYCDNLASAVFRGNAPASFGSNVFFNNTAGFTVHYYEGATGFTSPTWRGYPAVNLGDPPFPFAPSFSTQPANLTIPAGSSTTLTVVARGNPVPTLQWYRGTSGNTSQPVSGATSSTFTTPPLVATTTYWARATNSLGTADSNTAEVEVPLPDEDFTWSTTGGAITITGYTGDGGAVVIPATIGGLPVIGIGDFAFVNKTSITSISLPASLNSIANLAFFGCASLTAFMVVEENPAFGVVDGVLFNSDLTTLVQYPVGRAGNYAIPVGVVHIGDGAFAFCLGLTGVTIPSTVTSIGLAAFGLTGLTGVTIPASVTSIGDFAFNSSPGLASATFAGNAPSSFGGEVFSETAPGFTVYYYDGSTGFTSPAWNGYPAVMLETGTEPEIFVSQASVSGPAPELVDGAVIGFGDCLPDGSGSRIFTIANEGLGELSGISVSVSGEHAADFTPHLADLPATIPQNWATFGVTFVPGGEGVRSATLHISSNDSDEGELEFALDGRGIVVPTPFVQKAYMKAATPGGYHFGNSIAMSGDTLVSNAHYHDGVGGLYSRVVNVFTRTGDSWMQQAVLPFPGTTQYPFTNAAVAISGDILLIGAPEESNAAGAVYVFTRSGNTWTQEARLVASNPDPGDGFGISLGVSGETAVIGAYGEASQATGVNGDPSDNSAPGTGAAYVFTRIGGTWTQECYLKPKPGGYLESVAISGNTVVAGGPTEDDAAGGVYVFSKNAGTWSQQAYLKGFNTDQNDYFGYSVSLSGDTLAVGAISEAGISTGVSGVGTQAGDGTESGAAYIFTRSGGSWTQEAYLKPSTYIPNSGFGNVCMDGDTVVVGAPYESSNALGVNGNQSDSSSDSTGAAFVFVRSGGTWTQNAYLKASNGSISDYFGIGVAISGQTVAVSASGERIDSTGINGNQAGSLTPNGYGAGAVYAFQGSTPASAIQYWSDFAGLAGAEALPEATPFGDGVPNLLKFAFNMNGGGPDVGRLQPGAGTSGLPFVGLTGEGAASKLRVEFVRRKDSGLIYTPQRSTSLEPGSFAPMSGTPVVTPIPFTDEQWERVVVEEPVNTALTPRAFVTVEVTIQE